VIEILFSTIAQTKNCKLILLFFLQNLVAWFTFDPQLSGTLCSGLNFMNDNRTVSADGWEHCVALGSVGFSRGVHYWEFTIDKYCADTDPAFGIARIDVSRDKMLGK
jgi:tripartite motif-containing protein 9/67